MFRVLVLSMCLLVVGCATPERVLVGSNGNVRDLRLIQDEVISKLPADMQAAWMENLVTFTVRAESIHAYLEGAKEFNLKSRETEEWARLKIQGRTIDPKILKRFGLGGE